MSVRTEKRAQSVTGAERELAPDTNGDGADATEAPVDAEGPPRHRQATRAAHFGLAVLSVVIVVLGAAGGYYGSRLLPVRYAARAEIQYSLSGAQPNDVLREDRKLGSQVVLLRSRAVLGDIAFQNGMTPEELAENVSANLVENSDFIEIELRDGTPERAQALLTAVIDRYLAESNANWQDPVSSYLEFQLGRVRNQMQVPGLSAEDAARLAQLERLLVDLLGQLEQGPPTGVESSPAPPAQVLTEPYPVAGQVSPNPLLAAAAGAATAAVVAALVVLLVVRRRLRS
jgi:uncharacterized protein involved in exopolysaccharide biosynthesis